MPKFWIALWITVAVTFLVSPLFAGAEEERVLDGTYMSGYQNHAERLTAVFKRIEDGGDAWLVSFDFNYGKKFYSYSGTARGSFIEGEIGGLVKDPTGGRSFTFFLERGKKGKFKGKHAEVLGGSEEPTGTMMLKERTKKKPK